MSQQRIISKRLLESDTFTQRMKSERGIEYVAEKADTRHLNLDSSFD
jgi:hypothetical protein